jgi:hypothetical protein
LLVLLSDCIFVPFLEKAIDHRLLLPGAQDLHLEPFALFSLVAKRRYASTARIAFFKNCIGFEPVA